MDTVIAVLEIIAGAKSLVPGLRLDATIKTPDGDFLIFELDRDSPDFQRHLDEILSWESARPVQDHRT